jgi:hypothetical protein
VANHLAAGSGAFLRLARPAPALAGIPQEIHDVAREARLPPAKRVWKSKLELTYAASSLFVVNTTRSESLICNSGTFSFPGAN